MSTVMSGILHGAYIALAVLFLWMMNVAWHIVMQCRRVRSRTFLALIFGISADSVRSTETKLSLEEFSTGIHDLSFCCYVYSVGM